MTGWRIGFIKVQKHSNARRAYLVVRTEPFFGWSNTKTGGRLLLTPSGVVPARTLCALIAPDDTLIGLGPVSHRQLILSHDLTSE